jgi:hypothetical protein
VTCITLTRHCNRKDHLNSWIATEMKYINMQFEKDSCTMIIVIYAQDL